MLGTYPLLLAAGAILAFTVVIAAFVDKAAVRLVPQEQAALAKQPLGKAGAFGLIRKDKYLLLIALLVVLLNLVNSSGEYLLGRYAVRSGTSGWGASHSGESIAKRAVPLFHLFAGTGLGSRSGLEPRNEIRHRSDAPR